MDRKINVHSKPSSKSEELFHKINNYTTFAGLLNMWDDISIPAITTKAYYLLFFNILSVCVYVLVILEISALFYRDKFTAKQTFDCMVFSLAHPILYSFYLSVLYHKQTVKELLYCLVVRLKNTYNDENVEQSMIRGAKVHMILYLGLFSLTLALYGIDGFVHVMRSGRPFTTVITVWPDIEDESQVAKVARAALYLFWWILILRSSAAYVLTISTAVSLSHQFKNLQSYFYKLDYIFNEERLTQMQKQLKYEQRIKIGIKMHSDTLWCFRQCQQAYVLVYSGQIVINLTTLALFMLKMMNSERTILNVTAIVTAASSVLVTTGVFMCNAGDVTVEASKLATAIYCSGWQNCERASATRVRKLLGVAMTQAQVPVTMRGCAVTELSYSSYLSIVKTSYSVFSVVY